MGRHKQSIIIMIAIIIIIIIDRGLWEWCSPDGYGGFRAELKSRVSWLRPHKLSVWTPRLTEVDWLNAPRKYAFIHSFQHWDQSSVQMNEWMHTLLYLL